MKCLLFTLLSFLVLGQVLSLNDHKLLRIFVKSPEDAELIHEFELLHSELVDLWSDPKASDTILAQFSGIALQQFEKLGVAFEVADHNITRRFEEDILQQQIKQATRQQLFLSLDDQNLLDSFSLDEYHSYDEIYAYLKSVQNRSSSILGIRVISIGTTYENRNIWALSIGREALVQKKIFVLECNVHAREWVSGASCLKMIDKFVVNPDETATEILKRYDVHIIPILNPDGFEHSRTQNRAWRKNRAPNLRLFPQFCKGVDVNRNFDVKFGTVGVDARNPCSIIYCGKEAFSEKESQALRDYALSIKDSIEVYISLHSFSQLLMYPYGFSREVPANNEELNRLASLAQEEIQKQQNENYKIGNIYTAIYPASGSTLDWIALNTNAKYIFVFEMRDRGQYGFMLPEKLIEPAFRDIWIGIHQLVLNIRK